MLFDFRCPSNHTFEANVASSVRQALCPDCSQIAERLISAPLLKIPGFGDYPGAALKWARTHEKEAKRTTHQDDD
jgi:NMD protein affecting ribosome stability and mRNA decay